MVLGCLDNYAFRIAGVGPALAGKIGLSPLKPDRIAEFILFCHLFQAVIATYEKQRAEAKQQ